MANTTFNTRIKLKYDTLANWTTNKAKVLLKGEIGLCYVPAVTNGTTTTAPTVLFKVGDGTTTWEKLPWGSGLAADVYDWAKGPEKPSYNYSEIKNPPIIPVDTNTTYKLVQDTTDGHKFTLQSQEKNSEHWIPVSTITIPDNNNNQTITVGSTSFGKDDAVKLVAGDGITITPDSTGKTITITASKVANATHADNATTATTANKVANTLTLKIGGTTKATFDGSSAETFNITAGDLGLSSAMHFIGTATVPIDDDSATNPEITGYDFSKAQAGDVILCQSETGHFEFVWDGTKWEKLGDESSYALKTTTINGFPLSGNIVLGAQDVGALPNTTVIPTVNNSTLTIQKNGVSVGSFSANQAENKTINITVPTTASEINGVAVPKDIDDRIKELDSSLDAGAGKFIQKISIVDGKIDAKTSTIVDYPTLDKINVNTSANYVIFDCGSSTSNI